MQSAIAFIDGRPVPATMTPGQLQVLFPQGIAGLRSLLTDVFVFPEETGALRLAGGEEYTLQAPTLHVSSSASAASIAGAFVENISLGAGTAPSSAVKGTAERSRDSHGGSPSQSYHSPTWKVAAPPRTPRQQQQEARSSSEEQQPVIVRPPESLMAQWPSTAVHGGHDAAGGPSRLTDMGSGAVGALGGLGAGSASSQLFSAPLPTPNEPPREGKMILDRVYEHVMLPMVVFDIIDTPEFQRLRNLMQLGSTSYLYPGATHTRFEHSIGVAHLAGLMLKKIARRQPELQVTEADIICVTVAGLCHDLGHGPFSHLFENIVNRIRTEGAGGRAVPEWHHEKMSAKLLRRILSRMDLTDYNLTPEDANLIELCISGLKSGEPWPTNLGRPVAKRFILDIVSNKRNGIDVDKLDYFMRDSLCCYGRTAMDCQVARLLSSCKVICFENECQICFEEKLALSLGDIFTLRAKMHKYAYQHRIVKVIDHMLSDALLAADPFFTVRGSAGKPMRISECVNDVDGFINLGDWIVNAIRASPDPNLAASQLILNRISERNLYAVAGIAMFARYQHRVTAYHIHQEIIAFVKDEALARELEAATIVDFISIHYGSSDSAGNPDDPINHVSFYNPKSSTMCAFRLPKERMSPLFSPSEFGEKSVVLIVRQRSLAAAASKAFEKWKDSYTRNLGVAVPNFNQSPGKPMMGKRNREGSMLR